MSPTSPPPTKGAKVLFWACLGLGLAFTGDGRITTRRRSPTALPLPPGVSPSHSRPWAGLNQIFDPVDSHRLVGDRPRLRFSHTHPLLFSFSFSISFYIYDDFA